MENENTKLTDEQVNEIISQMDEVAQADPDLKIIANLPSNNGIEESNSTENGESKMVMVSVDSNTGENKIIGPAKDFDSSFESLADKINNGIEYNDSIFTKEELIQELKSGSDYPIKESDISDEEITDLLDIVNRKLNKEDFNIYKAFPNNIQEVIQNYVKNGLGYIDIIDRSKYNCAINSVSDSLIENFIYNIKLKRSNQDFAIQLEKYFQYNNTDPDHYTYQSELEKLPEEKKNRIKQILNQIDDSRSLTTLKEFAKGCKIKKIEVEMPYKRVYIQFLNKYRYSSNNIYDIVLAHKALSRALQDEKGTTLFLIGFCKQVSKYSAENIFHHAYMYYTIYNCINLDTTLDLNFVKNVREVIDILKQRNPNL